MKNTILLLVFILSVAVHAKEPPTCERIEAKIGSGKKLKGIGISLFALGAVGTLAGIIWGSNSGFLEPSDNRTSGDTVYISGGGPTPAGSVMVLGIASIGGGIVMTLIGSSKVRRYSALKMNRNCSFYLEPSRNGMGLAYTF